jgi:hypothetical protein
MVMESPVFVCRSNVTKLPVFYRLLPTTLRHFMLSTYIFHH